MIVELELMIKCNLCNVAWSLHSKWWISWWSVWNRFGIDRSNARYF